MKTLILFFLLLTNIHAQNDLDEDLQEFACGMNSLSFGITSAASGGQLDCSSRNRGAEFQQAPGFTRWLKLQFCSLIGGCVRRMAYHDDGFSSAECFDTSTYPINSAELSAGDEKSCLYAMYFDLWNEEEQVVKATESLGCQRIICQENVLQDLQNYLQEHPNPRVENAEEFFGCRARSIEI